MLRRVEQAEKLYKIMRQAEELGIDDLFTDNGLKAEEMAYKLYELGHLKTPSVEEMISEVERSIANARIKKQNNQNEFVRLWTAASKASNYNKSAWLDVERQLLDAGVI